MHKLVQMLIQIQVARLLMLLRHYCNYTLVKLQSSKEKLDSSNF